MLMMSTAKIQQNWFAARADDLVRYYLENDTEEFRPPSTIYCYDSTGSFVLGALVERITGKKLMKTYRFLVGGSFCSKWWKMERRTDTK